MFVPVGAKGNLSIWLSVSPFGCYRESITTGSIVFFSRGLKQLEAIESG